MRTTNKQAAAKLVSKMTDVQRSQVLAYHHSNFAEGRSLGSIFGFIEQPVRHEVLKMLLADEQDSAGFADPSNTIDEAEFAAVLASGSLCPYNHSFCTIERPCSRCTDS